MAQGLEGFYAGRCFSGLCAETETPRILREEVLAAWYLPDFRRLPRGCRGRERLARYARLRRLGYGPLEAAAEALPPQCREGEVVDALEEALRSPRAVIEAAMASGRARGTGWRHLEDEYSTTAPVFTRPEHLYAFLPRSVPELHVSLAFCSRDECYPTPRGLYPGPGVVYDAGLLGRRDIADTLRTTHDIIMEYASEVAIVLRPTRSGIRVLVYAYTENPRQAAAELRALQEAAERLENQLLGKTGEETEATLARLAASLAASPQAPPSPRQH